jgi:hypothetical protein
MLAAMNRSRTLFYTPAVGISARSEPGHSSIIGVRDCLHPAAQRTSEARMLVQSYGNGDRR